MAARLENAGIPGKVHMSPNIVNLFYKENLGDMSTSFKQRENLVLLKGIGEEQRYFRLVLRLSMMDQCHNYTFK